MSSVRPAVRWGVIGLVVAVAGLVGVLGLQRSLYLGVSTVLTPIESDTRERALLIAAGAGRVTTVRALLAQGIRPDQETFAAAVTGAFEPIYSWSGCDRHAEVTRMLIKANPRLRPADDARAGVMRTAVRIRGCEEVNRLIAN